MASPSKDKGRKTNGAESRNYGSTDLRKVSFIHFILSILSILSIPFCTFLYFLYPLAFCRLSFVVSLQSDSEAPPKHEKKYFSIKICIYQKNICIFAEVVNHVDCLYLIDLHNEDARRMIDNYNFLCKEI